MEVEGAPTVRGWGRRSRGRGWAVLESAGGDHLSERGAGRRFDSAQGFGHGSGEHGEGLGSISPVTGRTPVEPWKSWTACSVAWPYRPSIMTPNSCRQSHS